jgi:hypothetical protein
MVLCLQGSNDLSGYNEDSVLQYITSELMVAAMYSIFKCGSPTTAPSSIHPLMESTT